MRLTIVRLNSQLLETKKHLLIKEGVVQPFGVRYH